MKQNRSSINGTTLDLEDFKVAVNLRLNKPRSNGRFPVQIYVYHKISGKKKEYSTRLDFDTIEFVSIFNKDKSLLRKPQRAIRDQIDGLVTKICDDLISRKQFNFVEFEEKIKSKKNTTKELAYHFNQRIEHFKQLNSIGNASWYKCALKSIESFNNSYEKSRLEIHHINNAWLQKYEHFMIKQGRSKTTISMYLRALRAVYNHLIKSDILEPTQYPFKNFTIKEGGKVKKALSVEDIKKLYHAEPLTEEQEKAKDFWFFSYFSNGMNVKDIIHLKWSQMESNKFSFERIKTINTNKEARIIQVYLNEFLHNVINKYSNSALKQEYIFNIIKDSDSPEVKHNKTKAFTRFINQHMKKFATTIGVTPVISSYFARYSFVTNLVRQGKGLEFVQEALGHSSIKTTQNYFAGFEDKSKMETAIGLLNELKNI